MDFLKKHYEKILLSVVLLGLVVGALVFLLIVIPNDRDELAKLKEGIFHPKATPLPPLDLTEQDKVLQRLKSPYGLDFSTTNKLFNPVQWQKAVDGNLIKIKTGREIGAGAVVVAKITPLYFILTLDSVETNELGVRYVVGVERQAAAAPALRHKRQHYASKGEKNDAFTLTGVKGDPANPDQLVLKLTDTDDMATLSKDKPFQRVDGYAADLQYDPEGKKWPGQRVGADLKFDNDDYIIVAIHQNEVIFSAASNQKKTVLPYAP